MFIFAADLHLSLITWQKLPELTEESLMAFEHLIKTASEKNCPLVLGGDIFDSVRVTPLLLQKTLDILDRHPPVEIYYINGNHDSIDPSWVSFWPHTTHLSDQPVTLKDGEVLCGIDYQLSQNLEDAIKKVYPGCDYLIMHQTFDVIANNLPYSIPAKWVAGFNCVLVGDYHMPMYARLEDSGTQFWSPGSTNRRSIAEPVGDYMFVDKTTGVDRNMFPARDLLVCNSDVDIPSYVKATADNFLLADKPLAYKKGILVVRGNYSKDKQQEWLDAIADQFYCLFVPEPVETAYVDETDAQNKAVKGSKAYVLEMLQAFPGSHGAKQIIADYLGSPDALLSDAKEKLTL